MPDEPAPRYRTLADLKAAYDSGELPREAKLYLDNDYSSVHIGEADEDGDFDSSVLVYQGNGPAELIMEALDLLGIPWAYE